MLPKIRNPIKDYGISPISPRPISPRPISSYPEYLLQFDGCSKGNPGLSGAGAIIFNYGKEIWGGSNFVGDKNTNNEAEYQGLILGLEKAVNFDIKNLSVEGDSLLIIKQMNGQFNVRSESLRKLYNIAKELEKKFETVTYTHIYRNSNKKADELANLSLPII